MKNILFIFFIVLLSGVSGCLGWGDYMKFPPGPTAREIWFKEGASQIRFKEDMSECEDRERSLPPPVVGDYSYAAKARHTIESCMLEKGYTFKDALPEYGGKRYCTTYHGGPACKSIGR